MNQNPLPLDFFNCLCQNGKFINPHLLQLNRSLSDHIQWVAGKYNDKEKCLQQPRDFIYPTSDSGFDEDGASVVWINHSTFLVSIHGYNILTDPVFCHCVSPVKWIGPKRKHHPGVAFLDLPPIDFVIISHNHYDHLDESTVIYLHHRYPNIHWIVPMGVKKWFLKRGIEKVDELNWWQSLSLCKGKNQAVTVTSVPSQHYSGRSITDFNKTLWMGAVFESERDGKRKKIYFSGDTGYNKYDFKKIGEYWQGIDLSLIPIGVYEPRAFMKTVHVNPLEAVEIHYDVKSAFSIGMHWKTFHLSQEPEERPPFDLYLAMEKKSLDPRDFIATDPGIYHNW